MTIYYKAKKVIFIILNKFGNLGSRKIFRLCHHENFEKKSHLLKFEVKNFVFEI
jgi:hypothetical protein